ncbi:uncharacterized protein sdc3 [Brachyhypopomus gauderio]|uniref:uncharacterized protein sdc3 n=1 Tax=Brachyhypopomus gauderio TaxID=698409 RepID=UPI004041CDB0
MKLPCWIALALLHAHSVSAHRSSSIPVDEESSGVELYDDEDFFSGSGSGLPDMNVRPTAMVVSFTTEEPLPLSTTQATGAIPSAPPAAEPSGTPLPEIKREGSVEWETETETMETELEMERKNEEEMEREQESESVLQMERERVKERERARTTVVPRIPALPVVTTDSSPTLAETTVPADIEILNTTEEEEYLFTTKESSPFDLFSTEETITEDDITEDDVTEDVTMTEVLPSTVASSTVQPTTILTTLSTAPLRPRKPQATPSIAPLRPRKPQATPSRATPAERSTHPVLTSTVQVIAADATLNNEVAGAGPTGVYETGEDGQQGNEVGRGKGVPDMGVEPDLTGNTVDTGSSAAQLPQKNILERKEVLIAVIVGGVVGALFAAFLVMLLVYRMKKKDEGSYTLEEPKQATVTYQKPDKQEEFYA